MAYDGGSSVRRRRRSGNSFSIPGLFTSGALGLWYDHGTISTLFQDAAGTTAVAAAGDATGLDLDRSQGLVLGSELISNPGPFSVITGITLVSSSASFAGGVMTLTGGRAEWSLSGLTVGNSYRVVIRARQVNGVAQRIQAWTWATVPTTALTNTFADYSFILRATSTSGLLRIYADALADPTSSVDVSSVSVKELSGSHAVLSGANTLRPLYQITPARLVFDASDDRLLTALNPTTSGTIAARIKGGTASRVALGSQGASNGRAFLALAADGSLGAGIGADSTSTIKGSADIRAAWATGVVTWDGSTVKLYQDGAQVYSGAQNGAVNTTVPWMLGCLNNNATAASFWDGSIGAALVLDRAMTASEVSSLTSTWSTIQ